MKVAVIGGGYAGMAAAVTLAEIVSRWTLPIARGALAE